MFAPPAEPWSLFLPPSRLFLPPWIASPVLIDGRSSKWIPKCSYNDPHGGRNLIIEKPCDWKAWDAEIFTPSEEIFDFWGPEDPLGESRCVNVVTLLGSRTQYNFGVAFEPQHGSHLSPHNVKSVWRQLTRVGPGTLFGWFGLKC